MIAYVWMAMHGWLTLRNFGWFVIIFIFIYLSIDAFRTGLPPAVPPRCWVNSVETTPDDEIRPGITTLLTIRIDYQGFEPDQESLGALFDCYTIASKREEPIPLKSILAKSQWVWLKDKHIIEFKFSADLSSVPPDAGAIILKVKPATELLHTNSIVQTIRPERDQYKDPLPPGAIARMRFNLAGPGVAFIKTDNYSKVNRGNPINRSIIKPFSLNQAHAILDGRKVSILFNDSAFVWDVDTKNVKQILKTHKQFYAARLDAKASRLFLCGTKKIYDFESESESLSAETLRTHYKQSFFHPEKSRTIQYSSIKHNQFAKRSLYTQVFFEHNRFLQIHKSQRVHLWDIENKKGLANWTLPETIRSYGDSVAATHDGEILATANEGTVWIWDVIRGKQLHKFSMPGFRNNFQRLQFTRDAKWLLFANRFDGVTYVMEVTTGEIRFRMPSPLTFSNWHRDTKLISCGPNNMVVVVNQFRSHDQKQSRFCFTVWDFNQVKNLAAQSRRIDVNNVKRSREQ